MSATTSVRQAIVHAQLWLEGQFLQSWLSSDALMAIRGSGHGPPSPDQKIAMAQEDTQERSNEPWPSRIANSTRLRMTARELYGGSLM